MAARRDGSGRRQVRQHDAVTEGTEQEHGKVHAAPGD